MGNRIAKHVWKDETWERSTYYLLDAQGNQVSIYEHNPDAPTVEFNLVENNIYGSSRVGSLHREIDLLTTSYSNNYSTILGYKNYEFTNHLGNVLTVFTDKKIPQDEDNNGKVDGYVIGIFSIADYSPFGVELDGRSMRSEGYRYGFQNQEKDDEIKGEGNSVNYKYRMHDPRVGRFFSTDPLEIQYPMLTPYQFSSNSPIYMIELEGLEGQLRVVTQWYAPDGSIQKTQIQTYDITGLEADILKVCWKGTNNGSGPVTLIDYYGIGENGERLGGLTSVSPDAKPSVKELNNIFSGDAMNSFNILEKAKEDAKNQKQKPWHYGTVFSPGILEGNHDAYLQGGWGGNREKAMRNGVAAISIIVTFGQGASLMAAGKLLSWSGARVGLDLLLNSDGIINYSSNFSDDQNKVFQAVQIAVGLGNIGIQATETLSGKSFDMLDATGNFLGTISIVDNSLQITGNDSLYKIIDEKLNEKK